MKKYTASATVAKSSECSITAFETEVDALVIQWQIYSGGIVRADYRLGMDLTAITTTITLSEGATVSPASGLPQDFSDGKMVVYTVTADDGVTVKEYTAFVETKMGGGEIRITTSATNYMNFWLQGTGTAIAYWENSNNSTWDKYPISTDAMEPTQFSHQYSYVAPRTIIISGFDGYITSISGLTDVTSMVAGGSLLTSINYSGNELNALFKSLGGPVGVTKTIRIGGNPGTGTCTPSIATDKGWTVNTTTD
ncbi:MAG: DUF5018 domain-containing protein [Tannerella sp.]|nr:DUF5018 domain-containing protein [Tannerella sp.]